MMSEWEEDELIKYQGLKVLHVDGKASRGAAEKSKGEKPMKRVGEKENEISCLPDFLKKFNLKDTIVTVDAIGCNKTVIDAIHSGNGNYVIPVRENQKNLLKTILKETEDLERSGRFKKLDRTETLNKKHGRLEKVTMTMIDDTSFVYGKLGADSFYGSIARIGIMDKKITAMKGGVENFQGSR